MKTKAALPISLFVIFAIAIFLTMAIRPAQTVEAQNTGQGGTLTVSVPLLTNAAPFTGTFGCPSGGTGKCQGIVGVFPNIGQAEHALHYCVSPGVLTLAIFLEESPDNGTSDWAPISAVYGVPTSASGCAVIQSGLYYNNVRAHVTIFTGGTLSAWYSASTGPIEVFPPAQNSSGATTPTQCDQTSPTSVVAGTTGALVISQPNQSIYLCAAQYSFGAATGTGELQLVSGTGTSCTTPTIIWDDLTTVNTPQVFTPFGGGGTIFRVPSGQDVCLTASSGVTATTKVSLSFAQY
jgi:hypothetical protein